VNTYDPNADEPHWRTPPAGPVGRMNHLPGQPRRAPIGKILLVLGIILGAIVFVLIAVAINASKGPSDISHKDTQSYHLGYNVIGPHAFACTTGVDAYVDDHPGDDLPRWFNRDQVLQGCFEYKADLRVNTP
jgi:hypothetical protein